MRHVKGQSALELTLLLVMAVIALVAISRYVRFGMAGRIKTAGDGISSMLYDPAHTTTVWSSTQHLRDTLDTTGASNAVVTDDSPTSRREQTL